MGKKKKKQAMVQEAQMEEIKVQNCPDTSDNEKLNVATEQDNEKINAATEQEPVSEKTVELTSDAAEEPVVKKGKKAKWIILILLLLLLIGLAGAYVYVADYYKSIIFPGTVINGIDCSDMTVSQVEELIKESVEDYSLTLTFRDGSTGVIEGDDINYEYISSGEVQQIVNAQEEWEWIFEVFSEREYTVQEEIQFDENILQAEFFSLESLSIKTQTKPEDAYVTFDKVSFIIVPEVEGNLIRQNELFEAVVTAVAASQTELDVAELDVYEAPEIRFDNAELKGARRQLNEIACVSITYQLPNDELILDGNEIREWLNVDRHGNYSITEEELLEKVTEYVDELSEKVNTIGAEREFEATMQGDITISGGSYGYKLDKKAEIKQILEEIEGHIITEREPMYSSREVSTEANGIGDTYIEIDLSNQHLWYYIDGELYVETSLVSGTYTNASRRTPPGIFLLTYKARNRVLRGRQQPDGSYEYEAPVSYWMPFNGGIGLHDATWRGSFGGNIYQYSGSHGCINLPYNNAKLIYEKIDEETPIICYY